MAAEHDVDAVLRDVDEEEDLPYTVNLPAGDSPSLTPPFAAGDSRVRELASELEEERRARREAEESKSEFEVSFSLLMDEELQKKIQESVYQTLKLFMDFMARVAELDMLTASGKRSLSIFNQELEMLRRPPVNPTNLIKKIVDSNQRDGFKLYVEAGWKHYHMEELSISKLHACVIGLNDHLNNAKALLADLARLKENAISIANYLDESISDNLQRKLLLQASEYGGSEPAIFNDKSLELATQMAVIYNMLSLDFAMQERVVRSLGLKTTSSEMESYCLMWELRPYVDRQIMVQASKISSCFEKMRM